MASTALAIICLMIFCPVIMIGQAFPGISPVEMTVSFMPQVLLFSAIAVAGLLFHNLRAALLGGAIVLITATPFLFHSKHQASTSATCGPDECLTVITANIYGRPQSMQQLGALAAREGADLVAINEAVSRIDDSDYAAAFPQYDEVIHVAWENMPPHMGNPISLLSRQPVETHERVLREDTGRRAFIVARLGGTWQGIQVVVAHALTPMTQRQLNARNTLLREVDAKIDRSGDFILMGDLNTTPWSPTFRSLPGKRAGDPRRSNTWPTWGWSPLIGLSIDHILFDGELELVEFKVLESVGSDHYPILARFRRPEAN